VTAAAVAAVVVVTAVVTAAVVVTAVVPTKCRGIGFGIGPGRSLQCWCARASQTHATGCCSCNRKGQVRRQERVLVLVLVLPAAAAAAAAANCLPWRCWSQGHSTWSARRSSTRWRRARRSALIGDHSSSSSTRQAQVPSWPMRCRLFNANSYYHWYFPRHQQTLVAAAAMAIHCGTVVVVVVPW
jgi:hypothetical protein